MTTWVTVVAYDTPFLAEMARDHLDDDGITTRVLADSGGGNLPEVAFMTGGYRVQVEQDAEDAARRSLAALPEDALVGVDVGEFIETGGVRPSDDGDDRPLPRRSSPWTVRLIALGLVGLFAWSILRWSGIPLPGWY